MRILHTSDWHLGRSFHREGMLGFQAAYVDHLLEVIERERVDLVVVAGDIYDRALPPVDAVRLANETFTRIARSRAKLVVTSGNHDSAHRLGFGAELMDAAGVFVRTSALSVGAPVLLDDEHGPVAVYGLPYLEPDLVREPWALAGRSHEAALAEAMRRVRADLAGQPRGTRSVVMAHAFVAGTRPVEPSDSERDISVGGVSIVPTDVFDGIDYVALGHLHGQHTLTEAIRYSGSPLAYSFSETGHRKGTWLVDLDASGLAHAEFVEAPVTRALARISGDIEHLLSDRAFDVHEQSWVHATLTDNARPARAMERLQKRFPHTLVLSFEPAGGHAARLPSARPAAGKPDHAIAVDFLREMRGRPASAEESALLRDACDSCSPDRDLDTAVG
ncbi:exonuclease SbcCD subunit D [Nocardioides sp. Root140]|uniref:exonuclease SbcCD subunit D n=1 Tax=Nocardioides sp. Root140 TaxID=1736460 RepID=UPI0006FA8EE8|nr:exonuclease SbcCD subunit D [Nocardioides sp. Root140]KQY64543.1 DNA exonuclease SbcCD subunit SbcD [Nocardioides sp. Root140]